VIILGLTGGIAMGKSTAAAMFRQMGVPVHDADATVHRLLTAGGAVVAQIAALFPGTVRDGAVDRGALAAAVFGNAAALVRLEALLHPLVEADQRAFLAMARRRKQPLVVLDIPLLFETGAEVRCDAVVVVSAPRFVQVQRLMRRPQMSRERIAATLARQMPDREKCRRADVVIPSGLGKAHSRRIIAQIVACLRDQHGGGQSLGERLDRSRKRR
jgi:dephospho-CoA kinase